LLLALYTISSAHEFLPAVEATDGSLSMKRSDAYDGFLSVLRSLQTPLALLNVPSVLPPPSIMMMARRQLALMIPDPTTWCRLLRAPMMMTLRMMLVTQVSLSFVQVLLLCAMTMLITLRTSGLLRGSFVDPVPVSLSGLRLETITDEDGLRAFCRAPLLYCMYLVRESARDS
jgi:hypothetical protein